MDEGKGYVGYKGRQGDCLGEGRETGRRGQGKCGGTAEKASMRTKDNGAVHEENSDNPKVAMLSK